MTFSERLRELMKQHDYKQATLADRLCVSQQTVSRWVTGKFQPDIEQLIELAKVFNVSIDYLLGCEKEKEPTAVDGELDMRIINLARDLSPADVQRVEDFVSGIVAARKEPPSH